MSAAVKLSSSSSLSMVITGRQLMLVGGEWEGAEGGREEALVDVVGRELVAGEACGRRRGGSWVEADGGRELALVDVLEKGNEGGREEARRRED